MTSAAQIPCRARTLAAEPMAADRPITPLQILWLNMVTAVTPALALALEPAGTDVMRRPPRPPRELPHTAFTR
jgi:magnesium-transporting ATPase (P-type)